MPGTWRTSIGENHLLWKPDSSSLINYCSTLIFYIMPWKKKPNRPIMYLADEDMSVRERCVDVEENGSQRTTIIDVPMSELNQRQLDPRSVTLQNLIDNGITIEPGSVAHMLDLTDPAEVEAFNNEYTRDAYKFLQEHKDEIFKKEDKI